jgi:polar amino acid transport system substrate-binding protein
MLRSAALAIPLLLAATAGIAQSDVPDVPSELLQDRRHLSGESITFCLNVNGRLVEFDRAVATALADALLLKPGFKEINPPRFTAPLDYRVSLELPELYIFLTADCDAFVGWPLSSAHPSWMIYTRPYYDSPFVFVTTNSAYKSLSDVPPGTVIGTRLLSVADTAFATYIATLPQDKQWRRATYLYDQLTVERLLDGSIDIGMVWQPTLDALTGGDPESKGLRIIPSAPFQPPYLQFSLTMRERETFVRTNLDNAIVELIKDGTMEKLLKDYGLPGKPSSAAAAAVGAAN